jgi:hypothetical protein
MRERIYATLSVCLLLTFACAEPTDQSWIGTTREEANLEVTPMCLPGCLEDDEDPSKPGIFLTSAVTPAECFNSGNTDGDQDGLADRCERDIAAAFAPHLAISGSDRTGREPKWAAKPFPQDAMVRVAYLLSYYFDDGPTTSWCNNNIPEIIYPPLSVELWRKACSGHYGDAEMIVLDVYYHAPSKHWLLDCAVYSAHTDWNLYCRPSTKLYPALEYPTTLGGAPRSYVAYQKHANYKSQTDCNNNRIIGSDSCFPSRHERVYAGGNANIGSRLHHSFGQDCWASTNSLYAANPKECYWTVRNFNGWQNLPPKSDAYSGKLQEFGF